MSNIAILAIQYPAETSAGKIPVNGGAAAGGAIGVFHQLLAVVNATAKSPLPAPADTATQASPATTEELQTLATAITPDQAASLSPATSAKTAAVAVIKSVKQTKKSSAAVPQTANAVAAPVTLPTLAVMPPPLSAPATPASPTAATPPPGNPSVTALQTHPFAAPGVSKQDLSDSPAKPAAPDSPANAPATLTLPQAAPPTANITAAAKTTPPHPSPSTAITRQLANALQTTPAQTGTTQTAAPAVLHIALKPETLGSITVKITHTSTGDANVTITASQPETLASLKKDVADLNQILTNAGVPEAGRQIAFRAEPVAAAQPSSDAGTGNAANAAMQNNTGQQSPQHGTSFANTSSNTRSAAAPLPMQTRPANPRTVVRNSVDVIA